ncbi:MAG: 3-hydroxybutyryl-CoA dehydrogenase [Chloroflexi bacterium]|nr:3-hydroxybutyryl-CoA dehydrogenase [Chloroflexota bacterium]
MKVFLIGDKSPLMSQLSDGVRKAGFEISGEYILEYGFVSEDYFEDNYKILKASTFAIEAVVHSRELKKRTNEFLSHFLDKKAFIASSILNSSASEIGYWIDRTESNRVVGWASLSLSDSNPIVEIAPNLRTSKETIEAAQQFFTSLGKEPAIIRDCVGGVLPRVVASLINNAAYALMEGVASAADIDAAMKLGTNYPFGPLEWADKIGLDQVLGILEALCEAYGEDRYRPAPILRQLVYAGYWGQRTGRGFYEYP